MIASTLALNPNEMLTLPELHESSTVATDDTKHRLRMIGLRPTRQRVRLYMLLAGLGHKHFSAFDVYRWLRESGETISFATIYNNLNEFENVGIMRKISWQGNQTIYDTNTAPHHHVIDADSGKISDTDAIDYVLKRAFPMHKEIASVEITVTLRSQAKRCTSAKTAILSASMDDE